MGERLLWRCESGASARSEAESRQGGSAQPARNGNWRVLVVDDESSIRLLCQVNLRAAGMDVLEAEDGDRGLEIARRERPDLILLDVMMPGRDGWSVARELARDPETREIPVVFLTARAGSADRQRGRELGGAGYVVKPFDPVRIGDLIAEVIGGAGRGESESEGESPAGAER